MLYDARDTTHFKTARRAEKLFLVVLITLLYIFFAATLTIDAYQSHTVDFVMEAFLSAIRRSLSLCRIAQIDVFRRARYNTFQNAEKSGKTLLFSGADNPLFFISPATLTIDACFAGVCFLKPKIPRLQVRKARYLISPHHLICPVRCVH